jgi:hypothetical protein
VGYIVGVIIAARAEQNNACEQLDAMASMQVF